MNRWMGRLLLVLSIGGALPGMALVVPPMLSANLEIHHRLIAAFFFAYFLLGITAGITLVERPRQGLVLMLLYFLPQVPAFTNPFIYDLASGFSATAVMQSGEFFFRFHFGTRVEFGPTMDRAAAVGLNLVALLAVAMVVFSLVRLATRKAPLRLIEQPTAPGMTFTPPSAA